MKAFTAVLLILIALCIVSVAGLDTSKANANQKTITEVYEIKHFRSKNGNTIECVVRKSQYRTIKNSEMVCNWLQATK